MRDEIKNDILTVLKEAERDLSMREIARRTTYSRKTIEKYMPLLGGENLVVCTRRVGKAKMYTTNEQR